MKFLKQAGQYTPFWLMATLSSCVIHHYPDEANGPGNFEDVVEDKKLDKSSGKVVKDPRDVTPEGFKSVVIDPPKTKDRYPTAEQQDVQGPEVDEEVTPSDLLAIPDLAFTPAEGQTEEDIALGLPPGRSSAGSLQGGEVSYPKSDLPPIPVVQNEWVEKWIAYFTGRGRDSFARHLNRSASYKNLVQSILAQGGLPKELHYQALIESGFITHARSHANAVGIWQFIRGTGRRYGLTINYWVDERRDVMRATEAAAKYMQDLHNVYYDWYLALASYNCGEGCTLNRILKGNSRDFFELINNDNFPVETRNYIPKFLAAMKIAKNPEKYGFKVTPAKNIPELVALTVPNPVRLADIQKVTGIPLSVLKEHNPHILRGVTPPGPKTYDVWVPRDSFDKLDVASAYSRLKSKKLRGRRYARATNAHSGWHVVRRGESLYSIARKYRMSVSKLKRLNRLRSNHIRVRQRLRISSAGYATARSSKGGKHLVRRGDTLGKIARRYRVSIRSLRRANRIRGNTIKIGQRLAIPGKAKARRQKSARSKQVTYKVRRGDNLILIGRKFGIPISKIRKANKMSRNIVYAGQLLKIPSSK